MSEIAAERERTLIAAFEGKARERGEATFMRRKVGGEWRSWSWRETLEAVERLAAGLQALGLARGGRVLLVSENRPEWIVSDLAILKAGGITVPAYTTNSVSDHRYLIEHSGAEIVICSTAALAKALAPAAAAAETSVRATVMIDGDASAMAVDGAEALAWRDVLERAGGRPPEPVELSSEDVACVIYTSGTGGRPKGVMLSHANIFANIDGADDVLAEAPDRPAEVFLSFLPLSHSLEHTAGAAWPIHLGGEIHFAESVDALSNNLVEVRPTIMICVPRLYEVMRQKIKTALSRQGGLKAKLFERALALGAKKYETGALGVFERVQDVVLDRLVRDKVRARFGGRVVALVSGGAPLNYEVGLFFTALGLPLLQGYGQTECAPLISVNRPSNPDLRTVGPPVKGVEAKIAEDGEILVRGPMVMKGYWRDEEESAAAIRDGWLHTGDVGGLDDCGRLIITDRKKDIIVNSGGDNIAPQKVEGVLCLEPEIEQALVYGDRQPYLVALIVPSRDFVDRHARETGAKPDLATLARDDGFRAAIKAAVDRANEGLNAIERVRRHRIVEEPFSIENAMLTPTMKVRRAKIFEAYQDVFSGMYRG